MLVVGVWDRARGALLSNEFGVRTMAGRRNCRTTSMLFCWLRLLLECVAEVAEMDKNRS
jgi:hypothetical protein